MDFIEAEPELGELAESRNLHWKLLEIQRELKVEKGRYNSFGGFYSRSKEDILEAVKPLAHERGCIVLCKDEIVPLAPGWVYVIATASLVDADTSKKISATSWAREPESKPKMDSSQVTGSAASYAGKRALGNLFAIDDTADSDQTNTRPQPNDGMQHKAKCQVCGASGHIPAEGLEEFACPKCGTVGQFKVI